MDVRLTFASFQHWADMADCQYAGGVVDEANYANLVKGGLPMSLNVIDVCIKIGNINVL